MSRAAGRSEISAGRSGRPNSLVWNQLFVRKGGRARSLRHDDSENDFRPLCVGPLCVPIVVLANGPQAGVSFLRAVVESCLRLPIFCIVSLAALNALLTAEIVVELFRFGTRWTCSWSDKRHFIAVIVTWMALVSGQLGFALLARQRLLGG